MSSLEESSHVYDSVIMENTDVQMGVTVHTGAEVQSSVLMSRVKVGSKAIVKSSIIAPCCHIEEGEVNSSYMGPMTQMHHHSLLIAALWPDGCGNLGYGANVGSNHTGRMPDQEVMPGQGMFFGLGVNIKFPSNFRESPFTLIASGLTTLPQRLKFPFSLVRPGDPQLVGVAPRLNEVVPGWNYSKNAYALDRNAYREILRGFDEVADSLAFDVPPDKENFEFAVYWMRNGELRGGDGVPTVWLDHAQLCWARFSLYSVVPARRGSGCCICSRSEGKTFPFFRLWIIASL